MSRSRSKEMVKECLPLLNDGKARKNGKVTKLDKSLQIFGEFFICHCCLRSLKKNIMPPICFKNQLNYTNIPECLKLTSLEKQLIVKSLLFIKVRELPKTRMQAMNDRVINIPIEDGDIIKEATSLPRNKLNSGMISVKLKRKLEMKNYHKFGLVRPERIHRALIFLKENHPEYNNIDVTGKRCYRASLILCHPHITKLSLFVF